MATVNEGCDKKLEISLCMIVRDEEDVLERCLLSVCDVVDEIIIVDTGSIDRTTEIAKKFTDNLFHYEWADDFAAARNYSFSLATKEYIMWLDADDVLEDKESFLTLKKQLDGTINRVSMPYHLSFNENGQVTHSLKRNRIVKNDARFQWSGKVHEFLIVYGEALESDIPILHKKIKPHSSRNLKIYLKMIESKIPFTHRDTFYFANELMYNGRTEEAIKYYESFLLEKGGWIEDNITACLHLSHCYKELDQERRLHYLFQTFEYDTPRAEACCEIARYFIEQSQLPLAIFWLELIFSLKKPKTMGFVNESSWTYVPHIELCYCYDQLGQLDKSYAHHIKAREIAPDHPSVLFNEEYFKKRLD